MGGCGCYEERRFFTKDEKIEMLEEYKEYMEKEAEGVAEKIERLKKAS